MSRHILTLVSAVAALASVAEAEPVRILAYGDSNTWGWTPTPEGFPAERLPDQARWAGVLDDALGDEVEVVVDGLVGRTTTLDAAGAIGPLSPVTFNGGEGLAASIARNGPIDLVIVMLGTNDLQAGVERSPEDVAAAAFDLADIATSAKELAFSSYAAPKALVVAPPPYGDTSATPLTGLFAAGEAPSAQLGAAFEAEAERRGAAYVDAGGFIETDGVDGVHFTAETHRTLGLSLVKPVAALIADED
ncbi:MAG: GDSL-type esterase/lipase family protein [Pseudomonadota bacterium]